MNIRLDVAGYRCQLGVRCDLVLGALAFAQHALCFFLIVPEFRLGDGLFECFQLLPVVRRVKDSSAQESCAAVALRSGAADPRESCGEFSVSARKARLVNGSNSASRNKNFLRR